MNAPKQEKNCCRIIAKWAYGVKIYNNLLLEMVYNVHLSPLITVALSKNSIEKKEYKAMNTIVGKSNQKQVLHLIGQQ